MVVEHLAKIGWVRPARVLRRVDLPEPLSPTIARISCRRRPSEMLSSALTRPNCLFRLLASRIFMVAHPGGFRSNRYRAGKHFTALVVDQNFVQIGVGRAAELATMVGAACMKRMVLEIQRADGGVGRHGIDALLAPGAEELQAPACGPVSGCRKQGSGRGTSGSAR